MCSIALPADQLHVGGNGPRPSSGTASSRGGCRLRLAAGVAATSPSASPLPKKRVVFADARGLKLAEIRWLTETPSQPPRWSAASQSVGLPTCAVDSWLGGCSCSDCSGACTDTRVEAAIRAALDGVCRLPKETRRATSRSERCSVERASGNITGTIKVRNLAFEKDVCVRWTGDNWKHFEDVPCAYEQPPSTVPVGVTPPAVTLISLYDTFSFALVPPVNSLRMELAVRYRCAGEEYWDSREGTNYVLTRPPPPPTTTTTKATTATEMEASLLPSQPYW